MRLSLADFRLGAIYRLAVRCRLPQTMVVDILVERASFKRNDAEALAHHWFTTEALRT